LALSVPRLRPLVPQPKSAPHSTISQALTCTAFPARSYQVPTTKSLNLAIADATEGSTPAAQLQPARLVRHVLQQYQLARHITPSLVITFTSLPLTWPDLHRTRHCARPPHVPIRTAKLLTAQPPILGDVLPSTCNPILPALSFAWNPSHPLACNQVQAHSRCHRSSLAQSAAGRPSELGGHLDVSGHSVIPR
jgi:hypothetical protein